MDLCVIPSKVPSTDTPGTLSQPHQHSCASAPADLVTSVCTVFVPVCILSSAWESQRGVQQNRSRWSWRTFCVCCSFYSAVKGNYLFLKNNCPEKYIFIWLGINLLWKVKGREKCTHTVLDPPITVTSQQYGATHTYILTHTQGCVQYSVL